MEAAVRTLFSVTPQVLIDAGLIVGGDLTPEAALSKLSYVLAKKDLDLATKKKVGGAAALIFSQHLQDLEGKMKKRDFLCCPADGSEPARRDELRLCGHQAESERQPLHSGHRQIAQHQLQRGEGPKKKNSNGSPHCYVSAAERVFPFKPGV